MCWPSCAQSGGVSARGLAVRVSVWGLGWGRRSVRRRAVCHVPGLSRGVKTCLGSHLSTVALYGHQVAPLLDGLGQVHLAQRDLHLTDLVVLGESIEVVNPEDKGLAHNVGVGDLLGEAGEQRLVGAWGSTTAARDHRGEGQGRAGQGQGQW